MTNEQKRWNSLQFDNETVKIWLNDLLESKNKIYIEELTIEEIKTEIEETKGSIDNFIILGDKHAIVDCEEYLEVLKEMLNKYMNKKLVIVTTDMEIELAMFVDATKIVDTRDVVEEAKEKYYDGEFHSELFDDVLAELMKEYGIDFEFVEHEEM